MSRDVMNREAAGRETPGRETPGRETPGRETPGREAPGREAGGVRQEAPGERIARARRRRGLSQSTLAGLVGRSESWLSQVERGKRRVDSHAVLTRMAAVLRLDVAELTAPPGALDAGGAVSSGGFSGSDGSSGFDGSARSGGGGSLAEAPFAAIERAMMRYDGVGASIAGGGPDDRPGNAEYLRSMARSAYQRYQATRYDDTGRILPGLIREAETSSRAAGPDNPDMCGARVLVYDTAAAMLNRVGEPTLAWTAADRAITAARQSGRSELIALSAWRLSYVLGSCRHPVEALELAMSAADALEPAMTSADEGSLSVYGALHLAAATAAAAVFDGGLTASLLGKAGAIANRTGDGNWMGTAFGPANVAIHSVSAALQLGDPRTAIGTGEVLDAGTLPAGCTGRRAQLSLDLARAYSMRRQDAAAVNQFLTAERLSPQLIRYDTPTRDVLVTLLRREHQPSTPELRPLAHRAGVI